MLTSMGIICARRSTQGNEYHKASYERKKERERERNGEREKWRDREREKEKRERKDRKETMREENKFIDDPHIHDLYCTDINAVC